MTHHSFRQRVVESPLSLPLTAAIVVVAWMLPDIQDVGLWIGLGITALMSYIVVEWNTQYQLLRIRSRMNSITFICLMLALPTFHAWSWTWLPPLCLLVSYFVVFRSYGAHQPQGYVFYAFLLLSLASLVLPPLLLFVPFVYFALGRQLRAITLRSFSASLFGLLLPYVGALSYWGYVGAIPHDWLDLWGAVLPSDVGVYRDFPLSYGVALAVVTLLDGMSIAHFVRTAFNDKIRTRQYYYFLLVQHVPLWALTLSMPQHFELWLPLLILHATPFVAHYFALARGRVVDVIFVLSSLLLLLLAVCNSFNLWTLFSNFL